jgi:hypothetical protein
MGMVIGESYRLETEADVRKDGLGSSRWSDFPRDTGEEGFVISRFVQWHEIYSHKAEP